ncbi:MAG TPA: hypothetical protein VG389_09920 [Myxococcota bacterium]|jgi:hypothetical protein|nr:hypothetical protein [Myxococcota bacterium]
MTIDHTWRAGRAWRVAYTGGGARGERRRRIAETIADALARAAGTEAPSAAALDVRGCLAVEDGERVAELLERGLDDEEAWAPGRAGGGGETAQACAMASRRADGAGLRAATASAAVVAAVDPVAAAALVGARRAADGPRASVLAVVPGVTAHPAWAAAGADRYAVAHDDVAGELSACGVAAERLCVTGVPGETYAAPSPGAARRALGLLEDARVLLCLAWEVEPETLERLLFQLSLVNGEPWCLFGSGGDLAVARRLREKVPVYGLRGKLFGEERELAHFLAAADIVLGEASGWRALGCLGTGAYLLGVPHDHTGVEERRTAAFLARHRAGAGCANVLQLAAEIDLAVAKGLGIVRAQVAAVARPDPAAALRGVAEELAALGPATWERSAPARASAPGRPGEHLRAGSTRRDDAGPTGGLLEDLGTGEIHGEGPAARAARPAPSPTTAAPIEPPRASPTTAAPAAPVAPPSESPTTATPVEPPRASPTTAAPVAAATPGTPAAPTPTPAPLGTDHQLAPPASDAAAPATAPAFTPPSGSPVPPASAYARAIAEAEERLERWERRIELATVKGDLSLAAEARRRADAARADLRALRRSATPAGGHAARVEIPSSLAGEPERAAEPPPAAPVPRPAPAPPPPRPAAPPPPAAPPGNPLAGLDDEARDAALNARFDDLSAQDELDRLRRRVRRGDPPPDDEPPEAA